MVEQELKNLTAEQRYAATIMPQRQLVLAAAGSGKTSTLVGKVVYALASGQLKADEILVLAFNTKAAHELNERIQKALWRCGLSGDVTASTMHALGLKIINKSQNKPSVVISAEQQEKVLYRVIESLIQTDINFAAQWLLFRVFYHHKVLHPYQLNGRGAWRSFVIKHGSRVGRRYGFLTLRAELVDTQFEQAVANWLYMLGINYKYRTSLIRKLGSYVLPGNTLGLLQGNSCFVLPDMNLKVYCVTKAMARLDHGSAYILLDDFMRGHGFQQLLALCKVTDTSLIASRVKKLVNKLGYMLTAKQSSFLLGFIRAARLSGTMWPNAEYALEPKDSNRVQMHALMLHSLVNAYDLALIQSKQIDFEGMLGRSAYYLDQKYYQHSYKLILVDEFQDTSMAGVRLLQALLNQNSQCKLFAVGDDWQSIYAFAGAMPNVMRNFDSYFGVSTTTSLTTTFRFSQYIADTASKFIQANPMQLKKLVKATRAGTSACIKIHTYTALQHMYALCYACLQEIDLQLAGTNKAVSVFILGRYQHQKPDDLAGWRKQFPRLSICFYTVHASKGLEASAVIVLGLRGGRYGFPSKVKSDVLLDLARTNTDKYPYSEERRVFYVAITRTRGPLYLLAGVKSQSPFVQELLLSTY